MIRSVILPAEATRGINRLQADQKIPQPHDHDNEKAEGSAAPPQAADLALDIKVSIADSDFGIKLVNGRATRATVSVTNNEPEPISVALIGGMLYSPTRRDDEPIYAGVVRNLTTVPYGQTVAAGETQDIPYSFVLDMQPQDVRLQLVAVISNEKGQVFQYQAFNGTASIVEPPTSIFDPQM